MKENKYYAIWCDGDYLATGFNSRSPREAADALLELKSAEMDSEDVHIAKNIIYRNPEKFINSVGCTLDSNDKPF